MSSASHSQPFQLLLPAHLHGQLDPSKLATASLKVWSEETVEDFRKTAKLVAAEPWRLFVAQDYLQKLCDENVAQKPKDPPKIEFVFETSELRDTQVHSLFDDLFLPDDPTPRQVKVTKGKKRKMARPAAADPPASESQPILKRPAAASKRPAAASAAAPAAAAADRPAPDQARDGDGHVAEEVPGPAAAAVSSLIARGFTTSHIIRIVYYPI